MKTKPSFLSKNMLGSGLALAVAIVVGWSVVAYAAAGQQVEQQGHAEQNDDAEQQDHAAMQLGHITTQAEAEALKPGDMIAMACSKCKHIMLQHVTKDNSHVKLMTIGEKHKCDVCGGTVEVVGTGKGQGKNEQVNHVCSHCGDAMFVCATKPGSGAMMDMKNMKGRKKGK